MPVRSSVSPDSYSVLVGMVVTSRLTGRTNDISRCILAVAVTPPSENSTCTLCVSYVSTEPSAGVKLHLDVTTSVLSGSKSDP